MIWDEKRPIQFPNSERLNKAVPTLLEVVLVLDIVENDGPPDQQSRSGENEATRVVDGTPNVEGGVAAKPEL